MPHDVVDLHGFYRTRLGQWTRRAIREELHRLWPDTRAMRILGVGYATPYLRPFLKPSERVLAFMPARQGAVHWPAEGPNRVSLVEEAEFPLPDSSVDRVLMVHPVEHADELRRLLREIWRVLSPNGRVIVIVPNRHSLWSWSETTPFGHGRPFTGVQLNRLLRENMFLPMSSGRALFIPPTRRRWLLRWSNGWEVLGRRYCHALAGVTLLEAGKQLYAATGTPERRGRLVHLPIANPVARTNYCAFKRHAGLPRTGSGAQSRLPFCNESYSLQNGMTGQIRIGECLERHHNARTRRSLQRALFYGFTV